MLEIVLKDPDKAYIMNRALENMGIKNRFITHESNEEFLKEINEDPECKGRHLKPADRDLTLEELKQLFPTWTEVGRFEADLYYQRTPVEQMQLIAKFIFKFANEIKYISGSDTLLERGNIPEEYHEVIKSLEKPYEPPKELPEEEQVRPNLQNGILLCKTFGPEQVWVTYGRVEEPKFLKVRIYEEDVYNSLYRDNNGLAYLLVPLYDGSEGFGERVFKKAWELGIREHPDFFLPMVYREFLVSALKETGKSFADFYYGKEIEQRFFEGVDQIRQALGGQVEFWLDKMGYMRCIGSKFVPGKLAVLDALRFALETQYGKLVKVGGETFTFQSGYVMSVPKKLGAVV